MAPRHEGYMVFVLEGFNSICPQSDIKPHAWDKTKCHCNPQTTMDEHGCVQVMHNSFEETYELEKSLKNIYG